MSFIHILTAYINMNMLVIAGYLSLVLYPIMAGLVKKTIAARSLLKMHYAVLSILFLSILFYPVLPENNTFYPSVQIWSAQSKDTFIEDYTPPDSEGFFVFPIIKRTESFDTNNGRLAVVGSIILLQHKNNFQTYYAQCEKILAKEGQAVKSGDTIATCGSSGRSTGPHLHFELRKDGGPIDPEKYVEFN
jgi:hypothetical protein